MVKPTEIVDHVESVPYIMNNFQCESLVKEALPYHCMPHRQSVLQSPRTVPRSSFKLRTVVALGGQPRRIKEHVSSDVTFYDPNTKEWTVHTTLDQPRHHHAGLWSHNITFM